MSRERTEGVHTSVSEINPILQCNRTLSSKYTMWNRIDLRSNSDRALSNVNPMPFMFQSLFCNPILSFFPKGYYNMYNKGYYCLHYTLTITIYVHVFKLMQ